MVYKFIQPIYDDFWGIFYDFVYHIGSQNDYRCSPVLRFYHEHLRS